MRWKFEGPDEEWHDARPTMNPRMVALNATEQKGEGLYKVLVETQGNRWRFRVRVGETRTFVNLVLHEEFF